MAFFIVTFLLYLTFQPSLSFSPISCYQSKFNVEVWNDNGTGARMDLSIWAPNKAALSGNRYYTGMMAKWHQEACLIQYNPPAKPSEWTFDALAEPSGWDLVWTDAGTKGPKAGQMWCPICPGEFVALGCIWEDSCNFCRDEPQGVYADRYRCINERLAEESYLKKKIWDDGGSGGYWDGSVWDIQNGDYISFFWGYRHHHGGDNKVYRPIYDYSCSRITLDELRVIGSGSFTDNENMIVGKTDFDGFADNCKGKSQHNMKVIWSQSNSFTESESTTMSKSWAKTFSSTTEMSNSIRIQGEFAIKKVVKVQVENTFTVAVKKTNSRTTTIGEQNSQTWGTSKTTTLGQWSDIAVDACSKSHMTVSVNFASWETNFEGTATCWDANGNAMEKTTALGIYKGRMNVGGIESKVVDMTWGCDPAECPVFGECSVELRDWACCTRDKPCLEGQGDCEYDYQCGEDLYCAQDTHGSFDTCQVRTFERCDPNDVDWHCCTTSAPCDVGMGDCDNDEECLPGLVCGEDNHHVEWMDVCVHEGEGGR